MIAFRLPGGDNKSPAESRRGFFYVMNSEDRVYFPFAAEPPAILPETMISMIAFPPSLFPAKNPPVTSPAA